MYSVKHVFQDEDILFPAASHPPLFVLFPTETHVWRWTDGKRGNRFLFVFFLHCGNKLCLFSNWILIWKDSVFLYTPLYPIKVLRSLSKAEGAFFFRWSDRNSWWLKQSLEDFVCETTTTTTTKTNRKQNYNNPSNLLRTNPSCHSLLFQDVNVVFLLFSCSFSF